MRCMWNGEKNTKELGIHFGSNFHLFSYNIVFFFYYTYTVNEFTNQYVSSQ